MATIVENSDVTINISVLQSDGVTAYNLTGAEVRVAVYQTKERVLQLFEDGDVTRVSASGGTIRVFLDRANIENLKDNAKLYAELELTITDANFVGSEAILRVTDIELGTIKNTVLA